MKKALVAYFSTSGVTAKLAEQLASAIGADLHQIQPETPYTKADLNWMDQQSRSNVECHNKACRPAIANKLEHPEAYDTIFVGICRLPNLVVCGTEHHQHLPGAV